MDKRNEHRILKCLTIFVLSIGLVFSHARPIYSDTQPVIDFVNTTGESEVISMTESKEYKATVMFEGKTPEELKTLAETASWTLTREEGGQNEEDFPYQYLGAPLDEWTVFTTKFTTTGDPLFKDIKTEVIPGGLQLTFKNVLMFGVNGIDGRERPLIRNALLDYTGTYDLKLVEGDQVLATTPVLFKPYNSYTLYSEIDQRLADLAALALSKGIHAEVREFGQTAMGRPMNAIFIADTAETLSNHIALNERAESDPQSVIQDIESGAIDYKVPILYNNIHSDENPGIDAIMEFLTVMIENADGSVEYRRVNGLTSEGKAQVEAEKNSRGIKWSELIENDVTGVGYIRDDVKSEEHPNSNDAAADLSEEQLSKFYEMEHVDLNIKAMLEDVFFIVVPAENADAAATNVRTNGNGFDLNRDNTYQTQPETQAMARLISTWNPVNLYEIHGFYNQFQIEPCSPTHEPNVEYDLFIENALAQGEEFGGVAITNNKSINSFQMPMRDYLKSSKNGGYEWEPFDDMSSSYTPQYSMLHGVVAYTVEVPYGNEDATQAVKYALLNNGRYVGMHKKEFYTNQLKGWDRGHKNIDADEIRPYYVNQQDEKGAEADIFRARYEENNNFFPEYYVIPMEPSMQKNLHAATEMMEYLLRNDVKVKVLGNEVEVKGTKYPKGTMLVDLHQAKRNMANAALYNNIVIKNWTDLYSEPLTAFSELRGFDMDVITQVGAFESAEFSWLDAAPETTTHVDGMGEIVIVSNNSVASIQAINELLKSEEAVGFITSGDHSGDFVMSEATFSLIEDSYVLQATRTNTMPKAQVITKSAKLYVPGAAPTYAVKKDTGEPYGHTNYTNRLNTNLNWDYYVWGQELGFDLTRDLDEADIVIGNRSLREDERNAVNAGKSYIGYGGYALDSLEKMGLDIEANYDMSYDALTTVTYPESSYITSKYAQDNDYIMYGHGGNSIVKAPEGSKVLIKTTDEEPIEGFMSQEHIDTYKNSIQAIELKNDTHDLLIFANSITNKAHQKDDYRYVTNGIFTKYLGDTMNIDVKVPEPEPKPDPKVTLKLTGLPDKVRVGDVFVLTPSSDDQEKGEGWVYDDVFFSATFNSPATFTALKAGTTTITYTNKKGEKTELPITILEKEVDKPGGKLPGTGVTPTQTAIYVGIGVVLIGGVFYWFSKKKK